MTKSIINKAKELIDSVGKEEAVKVFEKKIEELGEPKNFEEICKLSGCTEPLYFIFCGKEN